MRLIDADELIKRYGDFYTEEGTEEGIICAVKDLVDKMPTVEPEHEWIPCSEGLPEEYVEVLLTDASANCAVGNIVKTCEGLKWEDNSGCWEDLETWIAWMPLPKSYRGDEHE